MIPTKKESSMEQSNDIPLSDRRFIVWDPKEGEPMRSEDGGYLSSGCMGVIPGSKDNPYLSYYGVWDGRSPEDLGVHERCRVTYSLSGSRGDYVVIRIA